MMAKSLGPAGYLARSRRKSHTARGSSLEHREYLPTTEGNRAPPDVAKTLGSYPELGREAARRIPNARLIEFPQLGHARQIQAPDEFHDALLRALAER